MHIDFRDWKYLSDLTRFRQVIDDSEVIAGNKEGNITIDFSKMQKLDQETDSKYVVGGRMYFEASVSGDAFSSFTTNGFFDQEGYKEPLLTSSKYKLVLKIAIPTTVFLIIIGVLIAKKVKKQK